MEGAGVVSKPVSSSERVSSEHHDMKHSFFSISKKQNLPTYLYNKLFLLQSI